MLDARRNETTEGSNKNPMKDGDSAGQPEKMGDLGFGDGRKIWEMAAGITLAEFLGKRKGIFSRETLGLNQQTLTCTI
jgi:hypothetical protein